MVHDNTPEASCHDPLGTPSRSAIAGCAEGRGVIVVLLFVVSVRLVTTLKLEILFVGIVRWDEDQHEVTPTLRVVRANVLCQ